MSLRPAEVDPQGGPITGNGVVPCHWQNRRLAGPMWLANDRLQWVAISFPDQLRIGLGGLAEVCGWNTHDADGRTWVSLSEAGSPRPREVLRPRRLADLTSAHNPNAYTALDNWRAQDAHMTYDRAQIHR